MADLTTVFHPSIVGQGDRREVPTDDVAAWVEQGWLKSEPKNAAVKAARKAADKVDPVPTDPPVEG